MNYKSLSKKKNPFDGLDNEQARRLFVYLCYVKSPTLLPEEVHKRWGISTAVLPPVFEANQIAVEIRREMTVKPRWAAIIFVLIFLCVATIGLFFVYGNLSIVYGTFGRGSQITNRPDPDELIQDKKQEEVRKQSEQENSAMQQKERMKQAAKEAEQSGAEKHAVDKWNQGIELWKKGDRNLESGEYDLAKSCYSEAEKGFKMAQSKAAEVREKDTLKNNALQQKKQMMAASKVAEQVGAKKYAVDEWNKGIGLWKKGDRNLESGEYDLAKSCYLEAEKGFKRAQSKAEEVRGKDTLKNNALQQKKQMIALAQVAEQAGAKKYAVDEWNKGIGAWKNGDQSFKSEGYDSAMSSYLEAQKYLESASIKAEKVEARTLLASLPSIMDRAIQLIRDNDRWLNWSVNVPALVSTGNELSQVYGKYERLASKGLLGDASVGEKSKLADLIIRCYERASDAGNGEASLQLCLLYGGAEDLSGADSLIPYSGTVFKHDDILSTKYLKRAVEQRDARALSLRDLRKKQREWKEYKKIKDDIKKMKEDMEKKAASLEFSRNWQKLLDAGFDPMATEERAMQNADTKKAYLDELRSISFDDPEAADKRDRIRRRYIMQQAMQEHGIQPTGGKQRVKRSMTSQRGEPH